MTRVAESRKEVERRLEEFRHALDSEVGVIPRAIGWVLPLMAFSVGLVVAGNAFRRHRAKKHLRS